MRVIGVTLLGVSLSQVVYAGCPRGQTEVCILPRIWPAEGCAQYVCRPDVTIGDINPLCPGVAEIGAAGYVAAAELQRSRHDGGVPLHDEFKKRLRGEYGNLVDVVKAHYSATMLDAIKVGNRYLNMPSAAQTFGKHIYFNMAEGDTLLSLVAHELAHTRQWDNRDRSLYAFGKAYFSGWCKAGFSYSKNKFERHARDVEDDFEDISLSNLSDLPLVLQDHHEGCHFPDASGNNCQAAIHRHVLHLGVGDIGFVQEVSANTYGIAAVRVPWYSDVSIDELREHHDGCTFPNARSGGCMAAIHRVCIAKGYDAGVSQEIGNNVFGVGCFNGEYFIVPMEDLRRHQSGCQHGGHQGITCISATHRICLEKGYDAGVVQELGPNVFGIVCTHTSWYGTAEVSH